MNEELIASPAGGPDGREWPDMSLPELREFIAANRWTFAKTMPKWPHEYVVLKNCTSRDDFFRIAMTIRRFGYDEYFFTKKLRYMDADGRRYWTMGDPLATTCVLNRALNDRPDIPWTLNPTQFVPNATVPPAAV